MQRVGDARSSAEVRHSSDGGDDVVLVVVCAEVELDDGRLAVDDGTNARLVGGHLELFDDGRQQTEHVRVALASDVVRRLDH